MVILGLLCVLCILLFSFPLLKKDSPKTAVITHNGEIFKAVDLSSDEKQSISVAGCVLIVENQTVHFESADCPDKLCVKSSALSKVGDTAACLPNKVVVTIQGENKNNYDMVAY